MAAEPVSVDRDASLADFMRDCFYAHRHVAYPVLAGDRPVGLISFRSVLDVPEDARPTRRASEAMIPLARLPILSPEMPLESAVEKLARSETNRSLVLSGDRLAGLLSITDATRILEARSARPAER